jgi:ABC-type uncharacterized transport system permease subunit
VVFGVAITDRQFFAVAVLVYGAATVYSFLLWQRGFRQHNRLLYVLILAGLALHTLAMALRGFSFARCPVTNLYEATAFTGWTIAAAYLVVGALRRLRFLGAFASPLLFCLGVFALMPNLDVHGPEPQFKHGLSSLHMSLSLLGYGAFGLGALSATMYLMQERDLKFNKLRAVRALLPPLERLESVSARLLVAGWALLTCGLLLGMVWLKHEKGVYLKADPKIIWSFFVWLVYLVVVVVHWRWAQRGRRFAWAAVGSFGFVMFTFWGFNLLSEIHHP